MNQIAPVTVAIPDLSDLPVRHSHLRAYGRSPAHGYLARTQEMKPTPSMQLGTAVHAIVFSTRKVVAYDGRRDKRVKEYQDFMAENADAEIMTTGDYDKANRMADAVRNCEHAKPWIGGYFETKLLFDFMGMPCRATPDIRGLDYITELKTAADVRENKFKWHARQMAYPEQLWFQQIACSAHGYPAVKHMIVAVESAPPHNVNVFEVQDGAKDRAARTLMLWMETLVNCEKSGVWPGYSQAIIPLDVEDDDDALIFADGDDA